MKTKIVILILLITSGYVKAQFLSTVFIDTVNITINNKNIFTSNETSLKFVPTDKGVKLTLYNDGVYKLIINLASNKSKGHLFLAQSKVDLFYNDTLCSITPNFFGEIDYDQCSDMMIAKYTLNTREDSKPSSIENAKINVQFRFMNFAPKDTMNYKYNYREGLWVGTHNDAKEVSINYQNDKKNGLAKAVYKDGVSYNVNFKNNLIDNYGQGYWENHQNSSKVKFQYTIPRIMGSCFSPQSDTYPSFYFLRNKKSKEVGRYHDLSVHLEKKGIKNDSLQFHLRGYFMGIEKDTMVIQCEEMYVHDFYKPKTDSLHDYWKTVPKGFAKVAVADICKVYYERSEWKTLTSRTTLVSLATAILISPLISIQKSGFNNDRFSKVTGASLGVAVLSISFGIAFSQKPFLIKPTKKDNKTWTIKPNDY